jgi:diacylglycerol kinase family enzyme
MIVKASQMTLRAHRRETCKVMLDGEVLRLRFPIQLSILPAHLRVLASPEKLLEAALPP